MREPKTGRTYGRGAVTRRASKTTRSLGLRERTTKGGNRLAIVGATFHRASAPGEAPAVDQGQLINSISTAKSGPLSSVVFTPMPYAWALEAGAYYSQLKSRRVVKIEPRPSFGPAVEAARPGFEQDCDAAIREVL